MKSQPRTTLHPFGSCMTVSVIEDAHVKTSTTSTASNDTIAYDDNNDSALLSAQWEVDVERKRSSSFEAWLHKTLQKNDDPQALARRAVRRAKRKAFFRKLFGRSRSEDDEQSDDQPRRSMAVDLSAMAPEDEASYRLNDLYYSSMANIMDQYRSDKELMIIAEDADTTRVSILELDEEDQEDDDVDFTGLPQAEIVAIPVAEKDETPETDVTKEAEPALYVEPPVRVPFEYTLQDRRGGTLVAGLRVLFTSAAFKRKQRQFLYTMRAIPEDEQFVVLQTCNSESEDEEEDAVLVTDGIFPIESDWV